MPANDFPSRRAPFFKDVPDEQWLDWRWQLSHRLNALEDFEPVSALASYPLLLACHPSLPVTTVKALIVCAKTSFCCEPIELKPERIPSLRPANRGARQHEAKEEGVGGHGSPNSNVALHGIVLVSSQCAGPVACWLNCFASDCLLNVGHTLLLHSLQPAFHVLGLGHGAIIAQAAPAGAAVSGAGLPFALPGH